MEATTPRPVNISNIRHCAHCGRTYDWRHSASSLLKMTYCGALCEAAALGFTLDALLASRPALSKPA